MSKTKSLTELVEELQTETERLQSLKKYFNLAVKAEFGLDVKGIHEVLTKYERLEKKMSQQGQRNQSE